MGFLIDTNILAELRKQDRGNSGVRQWYSGIEESEIYISVIALGEIRRGVELLRRRDPIAAERLEVWLYRLRHSLGDRLLPVTEAIADCWGQLGIPNPIPVADGLMAATALIHGLTLVTRDIRDVERSGVRLLNPFL